MHIEVVKTYEAFTNLQDEWEAVYAADPDSHFFLSWTWLSIWLRGTEKWAILTARPEASSPPVAFFPIRLRVKQTDDGQVIKEVAMAGNRAADYTGFICRPEWDDDVIPLFAASLKKISWDRLHLENIYLSPKRMRHFLNFFASANYECKMVRAVNKDGNIDNYKCPHVHLPERWDTYLNNKLSANTRQKVRRYLRKIDDSGDLRISCATADTIDRDLDILMQLWTQKWGPRKGESLASIQSTYRTVLIKCFEIGALLVPVFWHGEVPVGALASFMDEKNKDILFFVGAREQTFKSPPPGFILHAYSLRFAINNGFKRYDFLRGNEPYKYLFGCQDRHIWHFIISVKTASAPAVNVQERQEAHDPQPASP